MAVSGAGRRLFLALWPPDPVREAMREVGRRLAREVDGRRVGNAGLHLTLAFLGTVEEARREALEAALAALDLAAHTLLLDRLGYWHRPQVVWLGASRTPEALAAFVTDLRASLRALELPVEERPFVPHVTLLRKVRRRPPTPPFEPIAWAVDGFVLVQSELRPEGARYTVLRRWSASPGGGSFSRP